MNPKKCFKKQRRQPPPHPPAKSKVFLRRKSHLATAVIGGRPAPIPKQDSLIGRKNNRDGDITMPLSLKAIGSAGYRDQ